MQGTLTTTSLPPSVTETEVAETDTSFLEVRGEVRCTHLHSGLSYYS